MLARLSMLVLLAVMAGCGPPVGVAKRQAHVEGAKRTLSARPKGRPSERLKPVFGNSKAMHTVEKATTVRAFRLVPWESSDGERNTPADYKISAGPYAVSEALASDLRAVVFDPSIYGWEYAKGCLPNPGVRVQFQVGEDVVDILFCFECDILIVFHNGKAVGGEDFDDGRPDLVAIVKDLFPQDEVIQSLKPKEG